MMPFDSKFFQRFKFDENQIESFLQNAVRDFEIASKDTFVEVRFTYGYQALLKAGIALIAKHGHKTRSMPGHHVKIIQKMSEIL